MTTPLDGLAVCWIGNPRYTQPLNPTDDKKWRVLKSLGIKIYIIAFADRPRFRYFMQHARFYLLPELPLSVIRYGEMFMIGPLLLIGLIFRWEIRVIIAQSPFEGAVGALAKQIARLLGKRVSLVIESHGNFETTVLMQRRVTFAGLYRRVMAWTARYGLRHADVLRPVSNSARQQLEQWVSGKPMVQFMAWTDAQTFQSAARVMPLSQAHDLVYAGVLTPLKGVHVLVEAFAQTAAQFPDAHLWLIGKPENQDYAAELHRQVEHLGLAQRVTFVGAISQAELARYMARARALVLASSSEGLPRVVVEAMLNGLIVIASRVGGIPDIIQDGVTGYLIPPNDPDALAQALRKLYDNPAVDLMGQQAQSFAQNLFSEAAYIEGYKRLLEKAIQS